MPIIKKITKLSSVNNEAIFGKTKLKIIPIKNSYVDDVSELFLDILTISQLWGQLGVYNKISKDYDKQTVEFSEIDYTPSEAIQTLIDQMGIEAGNIYKTRLNQESKARITAVLDYSDFVQEMNSSLANALETGGAYNQWHNEMIDKGLNDLVQHKGYWNTVYTTNIGTSFNAGKLIETERLKEYIEYEEYVTQGGGVTPICQELSGQIRPVGKFGDLYPINHYGCNSSIDIISKIRAETYGIKPTSKGKYGKLRAEKGFNNKPTKYLAKLPKDTLSRVPTDKHTRNIINNTRYNDMTIEDIRKTKHTDIEFHDKINMASAKYDKKLAMHEEYILKRTGNKYESFVAVDKNGNSIYVKNGGENSVDISDGFKIIREKGYTATHNHPGGSNFSSGDVYQMLNLDIREMRALSLDHHINGIGVHTLRTKLSNLDAQKFKGRYDRINGDLYRKYKDMANKKQMPIWKIIQEHTDETMKIFTDLNEGFNYEFIKRNY